MDAIYYEKKGNKYNVKFRDSSGMSTLDQTNSEKTAKRSVARFRSEYMKGKLLKPTYRVAGYKDYRKRRKVRSMT